MLVLVLVVVLAQEVALGIAVVLPWIAAMGFSFQARRVLGWSFVAGVLVDLTRGTRLGMAALFYLAVAGVVLVLATRIRRRNIVVLSLVIAGLAIAETLVFEGRIDLSRALVAVGLFWLLLPLALRLTEETDEEDLRLRS